MAKQGIQWGTQRFQGNTQPNWYPDLTTADRGGDGNVANNVIYTRPNHPNAGETLEATDRGWERVVRYTDAQGTPRTKREVVVAQGDLANTLAFGTSGTITEANYGPVITDIRWRDANTAYDSAIAYASGSTEIGVVVTFSEPVYLDESGGLTTIAVTGSAGAIAGLRATSGNNTNKLVFTTTHTLVADETLDLVDSATFIALNNATLKGTQANTGYGRTANTPYPETFRNANVSSTGVRNAIAYDGLTIAVNAGQKVATS